MGSTKSCVATVLSMESAYYSDQTRGTRRVFRARYSALIIVTKFERNLERAEALEASDELSSYKRRSSMGAGAWKSCKMEARMIAGAGAVMGATSVDTFTWGSGTAGASVVSWSNPTRVGKLSTKATTGWNLLSVWGGVKPQEVQGGGCY